MRPLRAGDRVGRFEVVRLLGQGGTGVVYEARSGGETVALKLLLPDFASNPELTARARREGRALAALDHPGIVRVVEAGEVEGEPFLALEYLPGGTLASRAERMPWVEAFLLGARIAGALAAVHAAGLVHRDVKPANVFLDAEGRPKLGDFGFVKPADGTSIGITLSGETIGTPAFLAPEQIDTAKNVGPSADLYALGATLYALMTASRPFAGITGPQLLYAKLTREPPDPGDVDPTLPNEVRRLVQRLLARDPADRGKDAATVARELETLACRPATRSARLALVILTLVLGAAASVAISLPRASPPPPHPTWRTRAPSRRSSRRAGPGSARRSSESLRNCSHESRRSSARP